MGLRQFSPALPPKRWDRRQGHIQIISEVSQPPLGRGHRSTTQTLAGNGNANSHWPGVPRGVFLLVNSLLICDLCSERGLHFSLENQTFLM